MAKLPVHLDGGDFVVLPCSYAAMEEQRERFLRTGKGPSKFEYDCTPCRVRECAQRQIVDPTHTAEQIVENFVDSMQGRVMRHAQVEDALMADGLSGLRLLREQPLPTHEATSESVTASLRALLDARERKGIETYGVSLHTFNGRDAPRDLVEELIDATQYALQWTLERAQLLARIAELETEVAKYKSEGNS